VLAVGHGYYEPSVDVVELFEEEEEYARRTGAFDDLLLLTDRQREVLHLLACGRTDAEIARQLCITEGTVRTHIAKMKEALQVRRRWELVEIAHRHGLGPPHTPGDPRTSIR
jgi:DNA-binding NarL/FixJ family response regulator